MLARVVRWLQWGLVLSLLPLAFAYLWRWYDVQRPPAIGEVLGAGQGLLLTVAWLGAGLKELRDTPGHRRSLRDLVTWFALIFLITSAFTYGAVTVQTLAGAQTVAQADQVAWLSAATMAAGVVVCCIAVAVGTADASERT